MQVEANGAGYVCSQEISIVKLRVSNMIEKKSFATK